LPKENLRETQNLPTYVLQAVKMTPVQTIQEVLKSALLEA